MLSKEQKDALAEHYRGKDAYDPSKEPSQEPPSFCAGGMASGYADGGDVQVDGEGIDPSGATLGGLPDPYSMDPVAPKPLSLSAADFNPQTIPASEPPLKDAVNGSQSTRGASLPPVAAPTPQKAPSASQGASSGLSGDQMAELYQALSARPSIGQSAMSGLAGLADAIESGVARAPGPGFQKNLMEQQQNQKQNLIAALEAKYKGQGLGLENKRIGIEQQRADNELANAAAERGVQTRGQDITAKTAASERGVQTANQTREASQAQREADQKIVQEYSPLKPGGYTKAQYDAASARLKANGSAVGSSGTKRTTPSGVTYTVNQ